MLAVDQDAHRRAPLVNNGNQQVFAKMEANGDVIIGLFDYSGSSSQTVGVSLSAAGVSGGKGTATDLWSGASLGTVSGTYHVTLGAGAVKLIRVHP